MKKAFLVTFCPTTRVVVNVESDQLTDQEIIKAAEAAIENIEESGLKYYINEETIEDIVLDEELPYPQDFDL